MATTINLTEKVEAIFNAYFADFYADYDTKNFLGYAVPECMGFGESIRKELAELGVTIATTPTIRNIDTNDSGDTCETDTWNVYLNCGEE